MSMCFCLVLGVWTPYLVPRLRAKGPERGPPQSAFLPDLGAECAACGNSRQECLQTAFGRIRGSLPLGEGRFCSEAPQAKGTATSTAPALGQPGPDLPGLQWYFPMKG